MPTEIIPNGDIVSNTNNGAVGDSVPNQLVKCSHCENIIPEGEQITTGSSRFPVICETCNQERFFTCEDCEEIVHEDCMNSIYGGNRVVCNPCLNNYYYCDNCSQYVEEGDYSGEGLCVACYENRDRDSDEDEDSITRSPIAQLITTPDNQENQTGEYANNSRTFGLELEILVPRDNARKLSDELPHSCGITTDGSISGSGAGLEIVTPKLRGKAGEEYVKSVLATLKECGASVNTSCGFHLHLGVDKTDWVFLKNLLAFYSVYDDVILAMLPNSRRYSTYCKPVKGKVGLEELRKVNSQEDLDEVWYRIKVLNDEQRQRIEEIKGQKYDETRYLGINLHSAFYRGTVEIRYHSGTINPKKILNWIKLHQKIFEVVEAMKYQFSVSYLFEYLNKEVSQINQEKKREGFLSFIKADKSLREYIISRTKELNNQLTEKNNICVE